MVVWVPIKPRSERVAGKNLRPLNGKPLYLWCLEKAVRLKNVDAVVVYSSQKLDVPAGVEWCKRSVEFETSQVTSKQYYRQFALDWPAESYMRLSATSPFISLETYQALVDALAAHDSSLTVVEVASLFFKDGKSLNHNGHWDARTQDMSPYIYYQTGAAAYTRSLLLEADRFIGVNPYFHKVNSIEAIDIDWEDDWKLAEAVAKGLNL